MDVMCETFVISLPLVVKIIISNALEAKYGARPIIYTRSDIYYRYLEGFSEEYKMWISSLYTPLVWNYKEDWYIWQYLN